MDAMLARAGALILLILIIWCVISLLRAGVRQRRAQALAAPPPVLASAVSNAAGQDVLRILAFSSDDCVQCHRMQAAALARVKALRGELVEVLEVNAPSSPELTRRYAVLTLPTTVVLASDGRAHAINYGFAASDQLLRQCDDVLEQRDPSASTAEAKQVMEMKADSSSFTSEGQALRKTARKPRHAGRG